MKYKHIIWDWNGTLLNDVWLSVEIVNGLLTTHNQAPISEDLHKEIFDFPVIEYYEKLGFNFEKESFSHLSDKFIGTYQTRVKECDLHDNSLEILNQLESIGCSQSILSAAEQNLLNEMVTHFDLDDFFGSILGLKDNLARSKVEIGKQKVKTLDCDPSTILYIGDTIHDYEVAEHIGVGSVLIAHGHHSYEKLSRTGVPVVHSLNKIIEIID